MARRRKRRAREHRRCDGVLPEERTVQGAFDHDGASADLANCTIRSGSGAFAAANVKARPKPIR